MFGFLCLYLWLYYSFFNTFINEKIAFVSLSHEFITSSNLIAESSTILAKYFAFLKLHVAEF